MALIICPECGHQVSDKAETCPSCGIKIAGNITFDVTPQEPARQEPVQQQQKQVAQPFQQQKPAPSAVGQTVQPQAGQFSEEPLYGKKKDNKGKMLGLAFVIALILCGVGYVFWNNAANERKEQRRYEEAMMSTNVEDLKAYLAEFNDAPQEHRDSVNSRLAILGQEDNDWTNAVASGSRNALLAFINSHPNSLHKGDAENKIDSIDYAVAVRKDNSAAYAEYLKLHPDGRYAPEAQDNLDLKKDTEVSAQDVALARDVCKRFFQAINAHDESKLLNTVSDVLSSFLNRSGVDKSSVVTFMNKLYKDDITNMNWHILDDFKVEKTEGEAGEKNFKVQFSAEQKIDRTDKNNETYAKYIIYAEVTPEGRISKFNMKKMPVE